MGGSAIGGDLLKDWTRNKTVVPIEVNREYQLPAYAGKKTLVLNIKLFRGHRGVLKRFS